MKNLLLIAILAMLLSGCASFMGGGTYEFTKNTDGTCALKVNSNRQIEGAIDVTVTENCGVQVSGGGVTQGPGLDAETILKVLQGGG